MTTPAPALTVTADKATYAPNDPIVVTVVNENGSVSTVELTISAQATDAAGDTLTGSTTVEVSTSGAPAALVSASLTDSLGDSYTQQSLEGGTAIFAGTVGTPPAA